MTKSKIKKIFIICVMFICTLSLYILIMTKNVEAYDKDNLVEIDEESLKSNGVELHGGATNLLNFHDVKNLFCVQHNLSFTPGVYNVKYTINIDGNKARLDGGELKTSDYFARMAYILSREDGYGDYVWNSQLKVPGYQGVYSTGQRNIYYIWSNFVDAFGDTEFNKFKCDANADFGTAPDNEVEDYVKNVNNYKTPSVRISFVNKNDIDVIRQEKKDFITNNCTKEVKELLNTKTEWVKIGALQIQSNSDLISSITFKKPPKNIVYAYENSKRQLQYTKNQSEAIKFDKSTKKTNQFYILLPHDDYYKSSFVSLNASTDIKSIEKYKARLYVLVKSEGQRLIKGYVDDGSSVTSASASLNIKFTRRMKIIKTDKTTGQTITNGIMFQLRDSAGYRVKFVKNSDGTYTYAGTTKDDIKSGGQYETWIMPNKTIKSMKIGNYDLYEILTNENKKNNYLNSTFNTEVDYYGENYNAHKTAIKVGYGITIFDTTGISDKTTLKFRLVDKSNNKIVKFIKTKNAKGVESYTYAGTGTVEGAVQWIDPKLTITNMKTGNYDIYEIESDATKRKKLADSNAYYAKKFTQDVKYGSAKVKARKYSRKIEADTIVNGIQVVQIKIANKKNTGKMTIYKKDKNDNNILLDGVKFKVVYVFNEKEYLVNQDNKGNIIYTERETNADGKYKREMKDETKAKTYETKDGKIELKGLETGTYRLYEISNTNSNYVAPNSNTPVKIGTTSSTNFEVNRITTDTNPKHLVDEYTVYNSKYTGSLQVYKKDVHTNIGIKDMKFKIKYIASEGYVDGKRLIFSEKYIKQNNKGVISYVDKIADATIFVTNSEGILQGYNSKGELVDQIEGLDVGRYELLELKSNGNPNYTVRSNMEIKEAANSYSKESERTKNNFADVIITKNDTKIYRIYNPSTPRGGANISGKVWVPQKQQDKAQETISESDASVFKDNYKLVSNIKVKLYTNKALKLVTTKTAYRLEPVSGKIFEIDSNNKKIKKDNGQYKTITNLNKMEGSLIKTEYINYSENDNGYYEIATTTTNDSGKYKFNLQGVLYPKVQFKYFKVEFTYDGMDFKATAPNYDKNVSGSKATENSTRRTEINNTYATITGKRDQDNNNEKSAGTTIANGNNVESRDLEYDFVPSTGDDNSYGQSKVKDLSAGYTENDKVIKVNDSNDTIQKYNQITATYNCNTNLSTGNLGVGYTNTVDGKSEWIEGYYSDDTHSMSEINLALMVREMPDLSVSNQIERVVTTINGYNNLYTVTGNTNVNENKKINVQLKFVKDENTLGKIPVYPSDAAAFPLTGNNKSSNRLQLYITYKVSIHNNSGTLYNKVKELALYYNTEGYELLYVGTGLDKGKEYYCANNDKDSNKIEKNNSLTATAYSNKEIPLNGYSRTRIDLSGTVIGPTESKDLYVTYKIKDEYVNDAINEKKEVKKLKHIAEINAYSTYSDTEGKKAYAGVDKNSAPGNITNADIKFDEKENIVPTIGNLDNDTSIARAAGLNVQENRNMSGTVFLDNSNVENNKRLGDGIYNKNNEKVLAGVKVKLEIVNKENNNIVTGEKISTQMPKKIVIKDQDNKYHTCAVEQENGKYYYRYNNLKIELYTATTSETGKDNNYKISGYIPGNYKLTYTYNNETYYKDSDGKQHKINTEDYKSTIVKYTNENNKINSIFTGDLDWYKADNGGTEKNRYNEAVDDMNTRKTIDKYYSNMNMSNTGNTNDSLVKDKSYDMIASTPEIGIPVEKVSAVTTAEGNELDNNYNVNNMDFGIVERPRQSLKLEKKINSVKIRLANGQLLVDVKADENGKFQTVQGVQIINGAVHIEFDNELIHGSTLELGYKIKAINNSELDYTTENFYKYGIEGTKDERVKLSPQEILDYVDNNLIYTKDDNSKWNIINKGDYTNKIDNAEIYDNTEKSKINTILSYNIKENNNSIELAPGDTYNNIPEIKLEKLLSNTQDDEMLYGNKVEVITVNQGEAKEGNNNLGRRINIQLGTYNKAGDSGIGAKAENVTITPPTGQDNISKIYYAIIALGVLVIIAGGIVLIRHNIKKNK